MRLVTKRGEKMAKKYIIEYCCTYIDAVYLYSTGGIKDWYYSMNDFEDCDEYDSEEEARKEWNARYTHHFIWDPYETGADFDNPDVGISMYLLTEYDEETGVGTTLEHSTGDVTPEDIQDMYPDFDFEKASKEYWS